MESTQIFFQVLHSGIPLTLVPLDATNTIPTNENFFKAFEQNQHTYEAQYCFQSLKMTRDTRTDDHFYTVILPYLPFRFVLLLQDSSAASDSFLYTIVDGMCVSVTDKIFCRAITCGTPSQLV
jgi:uncharacterized membrane protein